MYKLGVSWLSDFPLLRRRAPGPSDFDYLMDFRQLLPRVSPHLQKQQRSLEKSPGQQLTHLTLCQVCKLLCVCVCLRMCSQAHLRQEGWKVKQEMAIVLRSEGSRWLQVCVLNSVCVCVCVTIAASYIEQKPQKRHSESLTNTYIHSHKPFSHTSCKTSAVLSVSESQALWRHQRKRTSSQQHTVVFSLGGGVTHNMGHALNTEAYGLGSRSKLKSYLVHFRSRWEDNKHS